MKNQFQSLLTYVQNLFLFCFSDMHDTSTEDKAEVVPKPLGRNASKCLIKNTDAVTKDDQMPSTLDPLKVYLCSPHGTQMIVSTESNLTFFHSRFT